MERIIAYHCAPALAGIKSANIVSCYKDKIKNIYQEIDRLNTELNKKDIYFEPLCECEKKVLLMVYRKKRLEETLKDSAVQKFLAQYDYPEGGKSEEYIAHLKKRLASGGEFSHEIGAFLGYPMHDIYGFMCHRDEGCLLCGEWKVYENADEARALFRRFDKCRSALSAKVAGGKHLAQMFC